MAERLLYTALDSNDLVKNLDLARTLNPEQGNFGYKVNLDHVFLGGMGYLDEVQRFGRSVFVDMKMFNGSRTMGNIVEALAQKGVRHTNVWSGAERLIQPLAKRLTGTQTELLGLTVLTHFDEDYCQRIYKRSLAETVRMWSEIALENGCQGIIVPGTTLDRVSDLDCPKLVPAIRPEWYEDKKVNDQEQTVTPTEAVRGGACYFVCGSPIHKSSNPRESLARILDEIGKA